MNFKKILLCSFSGALLAAVASTALAETDAERIDRLEKQVKALMERLDATAEAVDEVAAESDAGDRQRTQIGGYGELHYNNNQGGDDVLDFHRFVLFFGHEFNDDVRFFSEVEVEHALVEGGEESGEVELEQAYIEFDLNDTTRARAGLFLLPVGILNETHEPTTFFGVERNFVEHDIIPTTWWEGGAQLLGRIGSSGFSYSVALHSGLKTELDEVDFHDARQKVSEATANDPAATASLAFTGIPGLEIGGAINYQSDLSQQGGDNLEEAVLYEAHLIWDSGPFGVRALAALWDIEGAAAKNVPVAGGTVDKSTQYGFYVEPHYYITPQVGLFARYGQFETAKNLENEVITLGVNYYPISNVVLKADYQLHDADTLTAGSEDLDSFNLGIGYVF